MSGALKLLFAGPMGAGKTTAIHAVSEIAPLQTEAANMDQSTFRKATTTVAFDYGEVTLDDGTKIALYGTPGQERFDYMWEILSRGAFGCVLLMNNETADTLAQFEQYLIAFRSFADRGALVVGVGRMESHPQPSNAKYAEVAQHHGYALPIFSVDVRKVEDVQLLLSALVAQLELSA